MDIIAVGHRLACNDVIIIIMIILIIYLAQIRMY